jgi:hypothetical protein
MICAGFLLLFDAFRQVLLADNEIGMHPIRAGLIFPARPERNKRK